MSHQEHLQEAGGAVAHRSRVRGPQLWAAALILLVLLSFDALATTPAPAASTLAFDRVEAVRAPRWQDEQPPATGWVEVSLPDAWQSRWPGFDGVVWYRLSWTQADTEPAPALLLERLNRL